MGAEPWSTFAKYDPNIQRALDAHRREVFAAGDYRYADENPSSIDEALEIADADGTASILDIQQISEEPDFCCASPLSPEELEQYFGSDRPTHEAVESSDDLWEDLQRGQARYAIVYADGEPDEIFFAGYSFD